MWIAPHPKVATDAKVLSELDLAGPVPATVLRGVAGPDTMKNGKYSIHNAQWRLAHARGIHAADEKPVQALFPSLTSRLSALALATCVLLLSTSATHAQPWTPTILPSGEYLSVASSADGATLLAGLYQGPIYCTTNAGFNWNPLTPPLPPSWPSLFGNPAWHGLACSADGRTLAAVAFTGPIWASTNSGVNWSYTEGLYFNDLQAVACSADGQKLVAVSDNVYVGSPPTPTNSGIYLSIDGGNSWTQANAPGLTWFSVASSADGNTLAVAGYAAAGGPTVYVSTNSGTTWNPADLPNAHCHNIACSADGSTMIVGVDWSSGIFASTNSGTTWRHVEPTNAPDWCVACSADGSTLVAGADPGPIYFSRDLGASWYPSDAPLTNWSCLAASADGNAFVAATQNDQILGLVYTFQTTPTPRLGLRRSAGNLVASWTLPSRKFVLQETTDLGSPTWTNVTTPPVLNSTNLQQQVTVPAATGGRFYRLVGY